MARPIRVRERYTGDRSRLLKLEMAVEKDPRLAPDQRTMLSEQIRKLVSMFMDLDSTLPPLANSETIAGQPAGRRKHRGGSPT